MKKSGRPVTRPDFFFYIFLEAKSPILADFTLLISINKCGV